jgi:PAS domain S-box-containing protein
VKAEEASDLRRRAELAAAATADIDRLSHDDICALAHELQVHQIELEIQNEELRQAQIELSDTRDRYSDLYEFAPVGYLTLNAEGTVQAANLTAATMLGIERRNLMGSRFGLYIWREDREKFSQCQGEVFVSGERQIFEVRMKLGDENERIYRLESIVPAGHLLGDDPACFTALIDITARRESEERRLEQQCFLAAETEKTRIARELHDDLGSLLKGLELHTATLARQLEADGSDRGDTARLIAEKLEDAIGQTRNLAFGLHPLSDSKALPSALARLAEFADQAGLECRLVLPGAPIEISDQQVANHLYRIAQEAIHNAIRHSGASEMTISLKVHDDSLTLGIRDNGSGFKLQSANPGDEGIGLQIMRYRARAIAGVLEIRSEASVGCEIICKVSV